MKPYWFKSLSPQWRARLMRVGFNLHPAFRATGGRVMLVSPDFQHIRIKLPLLWPTVGVIGILTFVSNFNSFDLVYTAQGALAGPDFSTDILGTLLYRTFFGAQLQLGDPTMGAAIATMMLLIILAVVCAYLFLVQRRLLRHEF